MAAPTLTSTTPGWDTVDTSTEQTPTIEVTQTEVTKTTVTKTRLRPGHVNGEKESADAAVQARVKREYLEVVIGGNQAWLARASVTVIEQKDDAVTCG